MRQFIRTALNIAVGILAILFAGVLGLLFGGTLSLLMMNQSIIGGDGCWWDSGRESVGETVGEGFEGLISIISGGILGAFTVITGVIAFCIKRKMGAVISIIGVLLLGYAFYLVAGTFNQPPPPCEGFFPSQEILLGREHLQQGHIIVILGMTSLAFFPILVSLTVLRAMVDYKIHLFGLLEAFDVYQFKRDLRRWERDCLRANRRSR